MKPIKIIFFLFLYFLFSLILLQAFIDSINNNAHQGLIYLIGSLGFLIQIFFITFSTPIYLKKIINHYLKQKDYLIHH